MTLVYFPASGCVDDVVDNQRNLQFTSIIVEHFVNSARGCWIIRWNVFNVYVCLNHICRYEYNQFERRYKKPSYQRQFFFQNLDNFCIQMFFANGNRVLIVAVIGYTLLYTKLYYLKSVLWKKINCSIYY